MSEARVLIVEDEPVIAENISIYLSNNDFLVSGIAYDHEEARSQLLHNTPDVVLMDINLGSGEDGIDLAKFVNQHFNIPVLFLTSYSDRETIDRAKEVEPSAYVLKPFSERALLSSLEIAISNFARRHTGQTSQLSYLKINKQLSSLLTDREFEVLQRIYEGKSNQQISEDIFISVNTVKKHINSAYLKLDVETRTQAIARLIQLMK